MSDLTAVPEEFEALLLRYGVEFSDIAADREALQEFFSEMQAYFNTADDA